MRITALVAVLLCACGLEVHLPEQPLTDRHVRLTSARVPTGALSRSKCIILVLFDIESAYVIELTRSCVGARTPNLLARVHWSHARQPPSRPASSRLLPGKCFRGQVIPMRNPSARDCRARRCQPLDPMAVDALSIRAAALTRTPAKRTLNHAEYTR